MKNKMITRLLAVLFAALGLSGEIFAQEGSRASTWRPEQPRVLLLLDESEADHPRYREDLTRDLIRSLRSGLIRARHQVVVGAEIKSLQQRAKHLQASYVDSASTSFAQALCATAQTDYLIRVAVRVDKEKSVQRRMAVQDRIYLMIASAQNPVAVWEEMLKGEAMSQDSYADAHELALEKAAGKASDGGSIVGIMNRIVGERLVEDQKRGRRYYINVQSNVKELNWALLKPEDLKAIAGVTSVVLAPSVPERDSYEIRFKGPRLILKEALVSVLEERRDAFQQNTGNDVSITFASSMASIDVQFTPREAKPPTLESALKVELETLARSLYRKRPEWYLGVMVKFQPAHIASGNAQRTASESFVRKYWEKYEELRSDFPDVEPLDYVGSVTIDNQPFGSLREAKSSAESVTDNYYRSKQGQLALSLANMTESAFGSASQSKITGLVDENAQDDVLFMIKSEMDLYQNDGAVDPGSVAFFKREGTKRMVFTRIHRVLDSYQLWVTVVDAENGLKEQGTVQLSPRLTARLDEQLDG